MGSSKPDVGINNYLGKMDFRGQYSGEYFGLHWTPEHHRLSLNENYREFSSMMMPIAFYVRLQLSIEVITESA